MGAGNATTTPALAMRGVEKRFGGVCALGGVDFEVLPGEVHALIGQNGAGKSTLMKILAGVHLADAGELQLDGRPYAPRDPRAALDLGVAMMYQELNLAPHLTVAENVLLGREPRHLGVVDRAAARRVVEDALDTLGRRDIAPEQRVGELDPGARQVVEMARALQGDLRVLVLDEPTSSLGAADVERLFKVVRRLAAQGVAVIYISHFLDEIQRIAERYTVLRDGCSVAVGTVAGTSESDFVTDMVGRTLAEVYPEVPHTRGEALLELRHVSGVSLPRDASLTLHRGEILGLSGLVGAGRTELVRALFGLDPVRAGKVLVAGLEATRRTPAQRLAAGVGLLSEDRKAEGLALSLSIQTNLLLSDLGSVSRYGWLSSRRAGAAVDHWAKALGIRMASGQQAVGELSGGNQQKVALARLLHHGVDVVLLDEPTRGVDVGSKVEIYRRVGELAAAGTAVLWISSYAPELLGICDSIAVVSRGVVGPVRPAGEWDEPSLLAASIGGAA